MVEIGTHHILPRGKRTRREDVQHPFYYFDGMTTKEGLRMALCALDAIMTTSNSETLEALLNGIEDDLESAEKLAAAEEK